MFSCKYYEIFNNTYFEEHKQKAPSVVLAAPINSFDKMGRR